MKKYSLIRKTLKYLGFDSATAQAKNIAPESIEEDATVNYISDDGNFSGNITVDIGVDAEEVQDQLSATTGMIIITNGTSITGVSGTTETLVLKNEDGAALTTGFSLISSNSHATVSGLVVTFASIGSATITVTDDNDAAVYSKIKVFVTES